MQCCFVKRSTRDLTDELFLMTIFLPSIICLPVVINRGTRAGALRGGGVEVGQHRDRVRHEAETPPLCRGSCTGQGGCRE